MRMMFPLPLLVLPLLWLLLSPYPQYGGLFSLAVGVVLASMREGDKQLTWTLFPGAVAVILGSHQLISPTLTDLISGSSSGFGLLASWGLSTAPAAGPCVCSCVRLYSGVRLY